MPDVLLSVTGKLIVDKRYLSPIGHKQCWGKLFFHKHRRTNTGVESRAPPTQPSPMCQFWFTSYYFHEVARFSSLKLLADSIGALLKLQYTLEQPKMGSWCILFVFILQSSETVVKFGVIHCLSRDRQRRKHRKFFCESYIIRSAAGWNESWIFHAFFCSPATAQNEKR